MKTYLCQIEITGKENSFFRISVSYENRQTKFSFCPESKELLFEKDDELTDILKEHEYQLRKILHNKRLSTFFIGFKLNIVLKNNQYVIDFNDKSKIVVLDKTKPKTETFVLNKYESNIQKIYTDGCYLEKKQRGAYAVLLKLPEGKYEIISGKIETKSSCTTELIAVIEGLKAIPESRKVRIITDSRYVIKGLTEWINNWKLNEWHTAQGEKVKNKKFWIQFNNLTDNKYIEFEWVKSHSKHFENTLCDKYARETAEKE
jgi:ribonuclease HI